MDLTADAPNYGSSNHYFKHVDGENVSACIGPLSHQANLSLSALQVFEGLIHSKGGTAQAFSDSACTLNIASIDLTTDAVTIPQDLHACGHESVYIKHTYQQQGASVCYGPMIFGGNCDLVFTQSNVCHYQSTGSTSFEVQGLKSTGKIELFQNETCTGTRLIMEEIKGGQNTLPQSLQVDGTSRTLKINPALALLAGTKFIGLDKGTHYFYAKYTDGGGNSSCSSSPVKFEYVSDKASCSSGSLATAKPVFTQSSVCHYQSTGSTSFEVQGLKSSGKIQLFQNSTCTGTPLIMEKIVGGQNTLPQSLQVDGTSQTLKINPALALIAGTKYIGLDKGTHYLYAKYTDGDGNSSCSSSPVKFEYVNDKKECF